MSGRDSRERSRRDSYGGKYPPSRRSSNPPSRNLWVGNLGNRMSKSMLEDHFFRFGELDSISFPPGRSYAFVNFVREDDAVDAAKSLQGFIIDGLPLKIEFAKSDKSSASRNDNHYQQRDEVHPPSRRSAFSQRESTLRDTSPDGYLPERMRVNDDNDDQPSEILWIGFPSFLKVEETILRKAFSPFGEIDKISVFPGRTYAFVQFMNIASAIRARETLQGKLFGNPRVHICYARNDHASSGSGRRRGQHGSPDGFRRGRHGSPDGYRPDRNFGNGSENPRMRAPQVSNMEYTDWNDQSLARTKNAFEERAYNGVGISQEVPYRRSPSREASGLYRGFSPQNLTRKSTYPEDSRDLREDPYAFHEAKKLKTGSFLHDQELPEFPLHNAMQGKNTLSRPDESWATLPYGRRPDHPMIPNAQLTDRIDNWKPSHDNFQSPLSPFSYKSVDLKRNTLELPRSGMKEVWKWEGTIAKGGTPVCRARCFPVGKVMDIIVPEFLDCTARTGLDMLAKHYYQATNSWVVFFVAATDADMVYYNEFMHYLGDKQRAAVAKLDESNTLFLVPPSDFSEKVLKIPGKLSISGVVLSLDPSIMSLPPANQTLDRGPAPIYASAPLGPLPSSLFPNPGMTSNFPTSENVTSSGSSFIPPYIHGSVSGSEQGNYSHHSRPSPGYGEYHHSGLSFSNNSSLHENKLLNSSNKFPSEEFRPSGNVSNLPQNQSRDPPGYAAQTSQLPSETVTSLFSQFQQQPVQAQNTQVQDDNEGDPQKRLQATLQLAAALLQQIQQGKGN